MPGSGDIIAITEEVLHRSYKDAAEFMDRVIANATKDHKRLFYGMIPRGAYPLGQGLVRKKNRFYGPVGDQAGLTSFNTITVGNEADGDTPAFDSCLQDAQLVDWGTETIQYTGYGTARRTKDFCINDVKWTWEFKQQLKLIYGSLADVTVSVWETWGREIYLKFCADAGRLVVLAGGAPDGTPFSVTYDPFTTTEITIPAGDISRLEWNFMDWWHQALSFDVGMKGAVGSDADMPVYGLCVHPKDFKDMIMRDAELREDYRFAKPTVLIDQYGKVDRFQGFGLTHDMCAPRFTIKDYDGTNYVLERVLPWNTEDTTVGIKPTLNTNYLNAEFAIGIVYIKDVVRSLVPPAGPAAPAPGFHFGASPALNGAWEFLNYKTDNNPLGEKGRFFGRFQMFPDPGANDVYPVAFLYRRCINLPVAVCSTCGDDAAAPTAWVTISAATAVPRTADGETAVSYTQMTVTLSQCVGCEVPCEVSLDYNGVGGAEATTAFLTGGPNAPEYTLTFQNPGEWIAAGAIVAGTTTIQCV